MAKRLQRALGSLIVAIGLFLLGLAYLNGWIGEILGVPVGRWFGWVLWLGAAAMIVRVFANWDDDDQPGIT
jgi:hypothetical protein